MKKGAAVKPTDCITKLLSNFIKRMNFVKKKYTDQIKRAKIFGEKQKEQEFAEQIHNKTFRDIITILKFLQVNMFS